MQILNIKTKLQGFKHTQNDTKCWLKTVAKSVMGCVPSPSSILVNRELSGTPFLNSARVVVNLLIELDADADSITALASGQAVGESGKATISIGY